MEIRNEIREFLASRRARITPQQAGLPAYGGHRRVPGLRREEVALLAGVSVDYYTQMERGHLGGVSDSVLDALARTLQLDEAERAHLAILRGEAGRNPYDRRLSDLVGELSARSEEFRTRWGAHNVRLHRTGRKQLHHPKGEAMTTWSSDELTRIGTATELEIASRRRDDTLRSPRTIWVVRVGDDLYVRSMYGRAGGWFPGTQVRHEGHIRAGGVDKDVTFTDADPNLNDTIDTAYRDKYRRYGERIIGGVVNPEARAATIKLMPR
jgi:hypothetical protein